MSNRNRRRDRQLKEQERQFHAEFVRTDLPDVPFQQLQEEAIEHYNNHVRRERQLPIDEQADTETLHRLCVNYARHVLCHGYDASYDRDKCKPLSCDSSAGIAFVLAELMRFGETRVLFDPEPTFDRRCLFPIVRVIEGIAASQAGGASGDGVR